MIDFKLKSELQKCDMTIKELAQRAEVSTTTLSTLANGKSRGIQFSTLEKICNVLGVTPEKLLVIEYKPKEPKIAELRKAAGLSVEELAKELSIWERDLEAYENNKKMPSVDILIKLADYYKVTVDYLIGR